MSDSVRNLIDRGARARRDGLTSEALHAYCDAVKTSRERASPDLLAEALSGLARIEIDAGELDAALDRYREVEQIFRKLGEPIELAHALRRMADVLRRLRQLGMAEQAYVEAMSIYRVHEERCALDLANALRGLASLAASKNLIDVAIDHWREAGVLYETLGIRAGVEESDRQLRSLAER